MPASGSAVGHHRFGHAVVQQGRYLTQLLGGQLGRLAQQPRLQADAVFGGALDPANGQTAVARNVGGLGSPGRQRAQTRRDNDGRALRGAAIGVAIGEQRHQALVEAGQGVGGQVFQFTQVQPDFQHGTVGPEVGAAQESGAQELKVGFFCHGRHARDAGQGAFPRSRDCAR